MKKVILFIGVTVVVAGLAFAGYIGWALYPQSNPQPLPAALIAATSAEGEARLQEAEDIADYDRLAASFEPQQLVSYCGVASSVAVLQALGIESGQWSFFTDDASQVRSRYDVMFGGMSLPNLAGLLAAHGLKVAVHHADEITIDEFRADVERNLANDGDYLVVNYQREALGQGRVGHISPLAAYDQDSDSVLIMDTAAHKYPPTWVPLDLLYAGMQTKDSSSGKMRGYLEVSR
jgi:hypothetical protein